MKIVKGVIFYFVVPLLIGALIRYFLSLDYALFEDGSGTISFCLPWSICALGG